MNVLILTSAMIDSDFSAYQENAKSKPNPSNQNFYSKLIKSLAINNNIAVISHRPLTHKMFGFKKFENEQTASFGTRYYYTKISSSLFYKAFSETNEIIKQAKYAIRSFLSTDFVIVVDGLRYHLVEAAQRLGKMYNVRVVAMLTDNPANLSNVSKFYSKNLLNKLSKMDGYLALTKKLPMIVNSNKPSYLFDGLVNEENFTKKDYATNYFFFAGSLYERYGVKTLVDAYHKSMCKSKLIIAGNGPLAKYIDKIACSDSRILYLSQITKEKVIGYEKNAIANINPRPVNEEFDKESVPSKMLEYLTSGVPTISTKYETFYNLFRDNVYWVNDNSVDALVDALEKFENVSEGEAAKKAVQARSKAFEFYSINVQGELITHFLSTIK